ncbi:MAG: SAM-dependent methyltransferase [Actinomycetota bacterium]|nr:SAM-dependent methyltransferase [Actinomycetota bacterium]
MQTTDWAAWHAKYADASAPLSRRLQLITGLVDGWLDRTASAEVRILSVCAGDGRDLIGVLHRRADAARVQADLLELDGRLVAAARDGSAGLDGVRVHRCDAGDASSYADLTGADLVLLAGVFGNIPDADVERLIAVLPQLCRPQALVIWTRHRRPPDLTGAIREWFTKRSFVEESFTAPADVHFAVGAHRFAGEPQPMSAWPATGRLFTFFR